MEHSHPGESIEEALEHRGLTTRAAAAAMGYDLNDLLDIVEGGASIDVDLAERLEDLLGTPADFWLRLQFRFDMRSAEEGE